MLTVTTTHDGETSTVTIAGEIDLATSTRVNRELDMALDRTPRRLHIELAAVPFMDTTGVAVLLKARRRALEQGCGFSVTSTSPAIARLFEITGLTGLLAEA
ncbi:MAG TPA: STAS domain-containing protein [Solirubrobacter sp.]|nr:STAS domain-containing protein [Solirubrobacter sp.]